MGERREAAAGPRAHRTIEIDAPDGEALLVTFLSELVFIAENESMGFDTFRLETAQHTGSYTLHADLDGAPIEQLAKPIKAVTYHNLEIRATDDGLEVEIVFDV